MGCSRKGTGRVGDLVLIWFWDCVPKEEDQEGSGSEGRCVVCGPQISCGEVDRVPNVGLVPFPGKG